MTQKLTPKEKARRLAERNHQKDRAAALRMGCLSTTKTGGIQTGYDPDGSERVLEPIAPEPARHDAHYREIEATGIEPIRVMEQIATAGIPPEFHEIAKRNLAAALSAKHLLRMGHKDEGAVELDKAGNYAHRARHGRWA